MIQIREFSFCVRFALQAYAESAAHLADAGFIERLEQKAYLLVVEVCISMDEAHFYIQGTIL